MTTAAPAYRFNVEVDAPEPQSRLTVFFRLILAIPHSLIVGILGYALAAITLIAWFAILFTGKYPAGMLGFATNVQHWSTRANGYVFLLTGTYPPFTLGPDDSYPVRMTGVADDGSRNRMTTFFRGFMVIPHIIALYIVGMLISIVWVVAWFAALFTGSVPAGMHNFLAGGLRWVSRLSNYLYLLNDEYPPFSLN